DDSIKFLDYNPYEDSVTNAPPRLKLVDYPEMRLPGRDTAPQTGELQPTMTASTGPDTGPVLASTGNPVRKDPQTLLVEENKEAADNDEDNSQSTPPPEPESHSRKLNLQLTENPVPTGQE